MAEYRELLIVTKMEILKNTLKRITRHWVRDCLYKSIGGVYQYVLRSGSLWHTLSNSIPKNKRNVSLVISKLVSAFSLWLYNLVQPTIISAKKTMIQKVWEGILYRLTYSSFEYLPALQHKYLDCSTSYLKKAALDSLDNNLVVLIFLKSQCLFLNCSSHIYIILSFLLQF